MSGECTHKRRRWRMLGFRTTDGLISQELHCVDCGAPLVRLNGRGNVGVEVATQWHKPIDTSGTKGADWWPSDVPGMPQREQAT